MEKEEQKNSNRVDDRWDEWLRKHPHPVLGERAYDDRRLEAIMRIKKAFEQMPNKTREEVASMRGLVAEAEKLRKPRHAGKLERMLRESRNPIAHFFAVLLETIREMTNKWREKVGTSLEKPRNKQPQLPGEKKLPQKRPSYRSDHMMERQEKLARTPPLHVTHSRRRGM